MEEACRETKALLDEGFAIGHVAVNLSPRQFRDERLILKVADILSHTGLDARHLELEITEGLAMKDVDSVVTKLKELKSLGLMMAIDDFGTGYSSLSYLRRFPIDRLKIDQSFTREVNSSSDGAASAVERRTNDEWKLEERIEKWLTGHRHDLLSRKNHVGQ